MKPNFAENLQEAIKIALDKFVTLFTIVKYIFHIRFKNQTRSKTNFPGCSLKPC